MVPSNYVMGIIRKLKKLVLDLMILISDSFTFFLYCCFHPQKKKKFIVNARKGLVKAQ